MAQNRRSGERIEKLPGTRQGGLLPKLKLALACNRTTVLFSVLKLEKFTGRIRTASQWTHWPKQKQEKICRNSLGWRGPSLVIAYKMGPSGFWNQITRRKANLADLFGDSGRRYLHGSVHRNSRRLKIMSRPVTSSPSLAQDEEQEMVLKRK